MAKRTIHKQRAEERGILLTIWLSLMIISNLIVGTLFIALPQQTQITFTSIFGLMLPLNVMYFVGILSFINFVLIISFFDWKKSGFYGILVTSVLAMGVYLFYGFGAWSLSIAVWPIVMYLLIVRKNIEI
jgi:hypothetical protein